MRDAGGGERRDARGREHRPRGHDGGSGADVAAERSHVGAGRDRVRDEHGVVLLGDELDRHDGVRALRDDPAGRDPHSLPTGERPRRGPPRGDACDDRERPRRVCRAEREAVHRRAREGRQVDSRARVLRKHPPRRLLDRNRLARQGPRAGEDLREGVLDGDEIDHGADGTHGVRSGA